MKKLNKGALAMVFAGAVTFSVTNFLLDDQSTKRLVKEIAVTVTGDQNKTKVINQAKKTVPEPKPAISVKDNNSAAVQVASSNTLKSTSANPANTKEITTAKSPAAAKAPTTSASTAAGTNTTSPTTKPSPAPSTARPTTPAVPPTSGIVPTSPTTKKPNHGQEVSQDAKEKAASGNDQKGNNGKKM